MENVPEKEKAMSVRQEAASIRNLRWVSTVKKIPVPGFGPEKYGFEVTTKPGTLQTYLTHTIVDTDLNPHVYGVGYDSRFAQGKQLPKPVLFKLPEYKLKLYPRGAGTFRVALLREPNAPMNNIGILPQYQSLVGKAHYGTYYEPCLGNHDTKELNSGVAYRQAKTWVERATEAAMFLQGAEPHYGETWYVTSFAYRLGLVGEEMLDKEPTDRPNIRAEQIIGNGAYY